MWSLTESPRYSAKSSRTLTPLMLGTASVEIFTTLARTEMAPSSPTVPVPSASTLP